MVNIAQLNENLAKPRPQQNHLYRMCPERFSLNGTKWPRVLSLRLLGIFVGVSVVIGAAAQDQLEYRESVIPLSESELIRRAHDEDVPAQHQLATRLAEGRGAIPKNISQSLFW